MMRFCAMLLAATLAASGISLSAQQVAVRGTVTDAATGLPVAGVRVTRLHQPGSTDTGPDGRFAIRVAAGGSDTLQFLRIGYRPLRLAVVETTRLDIELVPSPVTLSTITSLASRRQQAASEIAVPVLAMQQDDIRTTGAMSLDRLLQDIPSLQQSGEPPARSTLMIRGIGGSRVLVMVDGEPVSGSMIEDRDLSRISVSSAEQVEVVRGPLAAIYGSEAIGGVINVVTREPSGPLALRGEVNAGSAGRLAALLEAGSGGSLPWRVSVARRTIDRISARQEGSSTLQRVWDARASVRTAIGSDISLRLDASGFRERQRWPVDGTLNAFNDNSGWNAWGEAQFALAATRFRARLSAQEFAHQYREAAASVPYAGTGAPVQREWSSRLLLTATHNLAGHVLDLGTEVGVRRVTAADRLVGGTLDDTSVDTWLQDSWRSGSLLLSGALRHGWSSRWGSTLTPSITAALDPTRSIRLRASVARGYRGPSFKETGWKYSNASAGYLIEGNPALSPEHSWQYSAGMEWRPGSQTVLDLDVYRNELHDLIDLRFAGTNPAGLQRYTSVNVASARTQGIDVTLQQAIPAGRLLASWSWLATRDGTTGQPLSGRVPHSLRLSAVQRIGPAELTSTASWSAATPAGSDGLPARADFFAIDLALRWQPLETLELHAGIDNLFDTRPAGWQAPIERSLRVGARIR